MSAMCKCGAETPDGIYLCHSCCARLEQLLCELDSVVEELVAAVPRASLTASYGERVSSSGSLHAPLPINDTALDAHMALDKYLMRTCLELAKVTGVRLTGRDSSGLASYLLSNMGSLRTQDWAGTVEPELGRLVRDCENVTREYEQKTFAGTCGEDGTDLYAIKGEPTARCRTCGAQYEVARWQAHAQTAKDYYIGTPTDLSRKLSAPEYGYLITVDQICKWAKRGKLDRANEVADEDGQLLKPTYRLGDILSLKIDRYRQYPINGAA